MNDLSTMPGRQMAITVETLFLVNLMLLPFVSFLIIGYLYLKHHSSAPPLAANHMEQTMGVGLAGGTLLVSITLGIALFGGMNSGYTWVMVILYFTLVHTSLILFGAIGLSKALSGKPVCYPLIGRWFLTDAFARAERQALSV